MAIRAIVFDIGGVLEIAPDLGLTKKWEQHLHLKPGELDERMGPLWNDGSLERFGVQPAEMIFLDDRERPVAAARVLGIHAILFQNTAQAIADIEAMLLMHIDK